MTNEGLEKLLIELNNGNNIEKFPLKEIAEAGYVSIIYREPPKTGYPINKGTYYLIKENDIFIGIVEYGGNCELHWLTLPKFRQKGLMKKALSDWILPHIFYSKNLFNNLKSDFQQISIDPEREYSKESEHIAQNIGFVKIEKPEDYYGKSKIKEGYFVYRINRDNVKEYNWNSKSSISEKEKELLVDKARHIRNLITELSDIFLVKDVNFDLEQAYAEMEGLVDYIQLDL